MQQLMRFNLWMGVILSAALNLSAQSTVVSVTVVDSGGQTWNNGTISYVFSPNPQYPNNPNWNGGPLPANYFLPTVVALNSSGAGTWTVPQSTAITPAGSSWKYVVCPAASTNCQTFLIPATGSTQNISSTITATLAPVIVPALNIPKAYADNEIQTQVNQGGAYYNTGVSTPGPRIYNGSTWSAFGTGGGTTSNTILYASQLSGVNKVSSVAQGTNATGFADSWAAIQGALNGGNISLVIDEPIALSAALTVSSNTKISCTQQGSGIIMLPASNSEMFLNAHPVAATTPSGTGHGFLVSNIVDQNIDIGQDCMLNANATQAVTGAYNQVSPTTGKWVFSVRFLGCLNCSFHDFTLYDSPAYGIAIANWEYLSVYNFNIQQVSQVAGKHNDGVHINGPGLYGAIHDGILSTSDDPVALNADDGFEAYLGDGNYSFVNYTGWTAGPIQHVNVTNIFYNDTLTSGRELSVTELIDDTHWRQISGTTQQGMVIYHEYSAGLGNWGTNSFDSYNIIRVSSTFRPAKFYIGGNNLNLSIDSASEVNPTISENLIATIDGTIQEFNITNPRILISSGSANSTAYINLSGKVVDLNIKGANFVDATGSGYLLCVAPGGTQSAYPTRVSFSNYSGTPNRQICQTFVAGSIVGDATSQITYLATDFTEHLSGNLTGTSPATTSTGDVWHSATNPVGANNLWQYSAIGATQASSSQIEYINIGTSNYQLQTTETSPIAGTGYQILLHYTNPTTYTYLDNSDAGLYIVDLESGTANVLASTSGNFAGTKITVTSNGPQITVSATPRPASYGIVTLPIILSALLPAGIANTSSTNVGFVSDYGANITIGGFSVTSIPVSANFGILTANLTLTTATSDAVTITGVTTTSKCSFSPTNSTAAGLTATTLAGYYTVSANTFTFNHAATTASGASYGIICSAN